MRVLWFVLLLIPLISSQDAQQRSTVISGDAAAATVEGLTDEANQMNSNTTTENKLRFPTSEEMLAQVPPLTLQRSGIPSVDAFFLMFPALSSLLRWGSLFPATSILGAIPDNLQSSASKVVLVLADDQNAQKSRVTRQNPPATPARTPLNPPAMLQQLLSQIQNPASLGQALNLGQGLLPDNLGQMPTLGQMPPMPQLPQLPDNFNLGQAMSSMGLPTLDGLLGAPAAAPPPAPAAATAKAATDDAPPPPPPAPPAAAPAAPALPFGAFFDGTNTMLGSALAGMPPAPTPDAFMAGLRQFWPGAPGAPADPSAQASDISEVRVKPDTNTNNYRNPGPTEAQLAQQKLKAALKMEREREQEKKRVPLLWFRMPNTSNDSEPKTSDQLEIESKLQAFERQVINELKLLQRIEAMAREMRASAQGTTTDQRQTPTYTLRYPLSRTPVHKITRADIERALRDDYVRRLLYKEAQKKTQREPHMAGFKRQTPQSELSKEDIINVMAYAYRMAKEEQQRKPAAEERVYAAYRVEAPSMQHQQQPMMQQQQQPMLQQHHQMSIEEARTQQQEAMEEQQRQSTQQLRNDQRSKMLQAVRQQHQQMLQQQQQPMLQQQQQPMLQQHHQMSIEEARTQQQEAMEEQERQSAQQLRNEQHSKMLQAVRQQQQQQQQQWLAMQQQQPQQLMQQQEMPQQRQFFPVERQEPQIEEKMRAMQEQAQADQQSQLMQQRQFEAAMRQQSEKMRQWAEPPMRTMEEQPQAQLMQQPMLPKPLTAERQWAEEKMRALERQQSMMRAAGAMEQQQQLETDAQKMRAIAEQNKDSIGGDLVEMKRQQQPDAEALTEVGEAHAQMPETESQARHKVDALGLGGNHHKKSKSRGGPTIINYYQQIPAQPPRPQYHYVPSYGTSYGGGGYASNAYGGAGYRAAVGNDEITSMLRQHHAMGATHFRQ